MAALPVGGALTRGSGKVDRLQQGMPVSSVLPLWDGWYKAVYVFQGEF